MTSETNKNKVTSIAMHSGLVLAVAVTVIARGIFQYEESLGTGKVITS